ncbi:glutamine amidotransferase [Candidatus Rickettsiella isopodorum]|jgi:enhancing lycopene biosynthesis protein 2|uniref:Glyoxalase n=1 Tax=Candidatus Rickettsiella isopodorum TaxID=1225476 RepID=A0A1J8NJH8_9COXI|nr:isoprenoid biosynthesis glyoxalase ElbB [Candidatus Rickettsiella isopodorum]OIZ94214.1 glutamine amidotransferase [Candidatus Rickettsiella isopodorum]
MKNQHIAVVLSGCGALDGSEIHESVLTLLALDRAELAYQCLAPNLSQTRVVNMIDGKTQEHVKRNILEESARIARGKIKDIALANADDYTAMIFPGGFGAALNLCNFGLNKENYSLQANVFKFAKAMVEAKKPAGFICIAPVLAPKLYPAGIKITIGNDKAIAEILEKLGAQPIPCAATDCVVDKTHKLVTTPAYMLARSIKEIAMGIECLVKELSLLLNT